MSIISIDWCHIQGKNYLVTTDHSSGYIWSKQSAHRNTKTCIRILKTLFAKVGFPTIVQSDNTGEFRQEFTNKLKALGIKHTTSSPFNPESNSRAEMAVQKFKRNNEKNHQKTT